MLKKLPIAASFLFAMTHSALAGVTVYDCAPSNIEKKWGWISERVIIFVDDKEQKAFVMDGYTVLENEDPIYADYTELKNGKFRIRWSISNIPTRGGSSGKASWSATVSPTKHDMQIRATVHGYDNRPRGHGMCEVTYHK